MALLLAALGALGASWPVLRAILWSRSPDLPGSTSMTASLIADPMAIHNRMLGADLAGFGWPWTSPSPGYHGAYLGLALLTLALLGTHRASRTSRSEQSRDQPWLLAGLALWMTVLSLGFHLKVGGQVVLVGNEPIELPAAWLSRVIEPLGRAPRWHRAALLAALLLCPLAARGAVRLARHRSVLAILALVTCLDALVLGDDAWPRRSFAGSAPDAWARLADPGAIVQLPAPRSTATQKGSTRNLALLWQSWHGRAMAHNPQRPDLRERDAVTRQLVSAVTRRTRRGDSPGELLEDLASRGFSYLVHTPQAHDPSISRRLREALGDPTIDTDELWAWRLPSPSPGP
ncbi:MAG: hypothetical protein QGG40_04945 [Myxococcota bacterium]|nr:hypothetical protein [Myxococcota bacterium]